MALSRQKAIVKQLSAIQNLGAMDILCTDKTGTLTQDHVVLIKTWMCTARTASGFSQHAYLNSFFQTGLKNLLDRAVVERAEAARAARAGEVVPEGGRSCRSTSIAAACRSS